jgi:hypothetical protein
MDFTNITAGVCASTSVHAILSRAGFCVRGTRATCPYCGPEHRRASLTVAIHRELWHCHRCKRGGHIRTLARGQGLRFPKPRVRKADFPKQQFRAWLFEKMSAFGVEERRAYRMEQLAHSLLNQEPESFAAWKFLAWFHRRRRVWEAFWQSATDRCGRYWLYRAWRQWSPNAK